MAGEVVTSPGEGAAGRGEGIAGEAGGVGVRGGREQMPPERESVGKHAGSRKAKTDVRLVGEGGTILFV